MTDAGNAPDGGSSRWSEDPRVYFAAERTLLAWVRTGIALMGFGFIVARFGLFLREVAAIREPVHGAQGGTSLWIGTGLVFLGVCVNAVAAAQHVQSISRLQRGRSLFAPRLSLGVVLSGILALLGLGLVAYLLMMEWSGGVG